MPGGRRARPSASAPHRGPNCQSLLKSLCSAAEKTHIHRTHPAPAPVFSSLRQGPQARHGATLGRKSFQSMREKKGKARADADGHVLVPPRPRRSSRALSFAHRRKTMARRWFDVSELDRSFARAERGKAKEGARRRAELMRICREGLWSVMAPG
jgi:hypothetical protein